MKWPWQKQSKSDELRTLIDRATVQSTAQAAETPEFIEALARAEEDDFSIDLPFYPGDGSCQCRHECGCVWSIESTFEDMEEVTTATWEVAANDCGICHHRSVEWHSREIGRRPRTDIPPSGGLQPEKAY